MLNSHPNHSSLIYYYRDCLRERYWLKCNDSIYFLHYSNQFQFQCKCLVITGKIIDNRYNLPDKNRHFIPTTVIGIFLSRAEYAYYHTKKLCLLPEICILRNVTWRQPID